MKTNRIIQLCIACTVILAVYGGVFAADPPSASEWGIPLAATAKPTLAHPVGTNLRVTNDPDIQNQTSVAADPNDPEVIVCSFHDFSLPSYIGLAYSHDGGHTFTHHPTGIPLPAGFDDRGPDLSVAFDSKSHVYLSHMGIGPGATLFTANNGIFVARSDDGGINWHPTVPVDTNQWPGSGVIDLEDRAQITVDTHAGSPYQDRIYVAWTRFYGGNYPGTATLGGGDIMVAYSDDSGSTWSPPALLTGPSHLPTNGGTGSHTSMVHSPEPTAGADGSVYVTYYFSGRTEVQRSTDGGVTWGLPTHPFGNTSDASELLDHDPGLAGRQLPDLDFKHLISANIETDPHDTGTIYVVTADDPDNTTSGDGADVLFARSTDYGATWEAALTLNDDEGTSSQFMPWMAVSKYGGIAVIWYDTRLSPTNSTLDIFSTFSANGGVSFDSNVRVTDVTFEPNTGQFPDNAYIGYNQGLGVSEGIFHCMWMDARDGDQEIYYDSFGDYYDCFIPKTGDVNENGSITSADIIYMVGYVFKGGSAPLPCPAAGDVNCNGSVTSADIISLVGYVFKGGTPPCDVCDLIPFEWTCP